MKQTRYFILGLLILIGLGGCSLTSSTLSNDDKEVLITSIPPIADIVEKIAGDNFEVYSIVSENSSPEDYEISTKDLKKINSAKAYFVHGAFTFEKQYLENIKQEYPDVAIIPVNTNIDLLEIDEDDHEHHDEIILSAFGTEPFWQLEVKDGKLYYETPEKKWEAIDINISKTGENLIINGITAKVSFTKKECVDDSKGDTHDYAVQVDFPGIQVFGCGDLNHEEDKYEEESHHNHDEENISFGSEHHHDHGDFDPHYWVSIKNIQVIAQDITTYLVSTTQDKDKQEYYKSNLENFLAESSTLMATKNSVDHLYIYHPSINYFAHERGIDVIAFQQHGKETTVASLQYTLKDLDIEKDIVLVDQQTPESFIQYLDKKGIQTKLFNPLKKDIIQNIKDLTILLAS